MWQGILDLQREIYLAFAGHIRAVAAGGGWLAFAASLPLGMLLGSVHALTPGHSKSVLAAYLAGSPTGAGRALLVSLALAATHVGSAVVIAWFSLPLVSRLLGSAGDAPQIALTSRALLGLIGLWMLARAVRPAHHSHSAGEGLAVGFVAGLIPCPLTLFVMTFAMVQGVPAAGVMFAGSMMLGISATLGLVALACVLFRERLQAALAGHPARIDGLMRLLEAAAGLVLVGIAASAFAGT